MDDKYSKYQRSNSECSTGCYGLYSPAHPKWIEVPLFCFIWKSPLGYTSKRGTYNGIASYKNISEAKNRTRRNILQGHRRELSRTQLSQRENLKAVSPRWATPRSIRRAPCFLLTAIFCNERIQWRAASSGQKQPSGPNERPNIGILCICWRWPRHLLGLVLRCSFVPRFRLWCLRFPSKSTASRRPFYSISIVVGWFAYWIVSLNTTSNVQNSEKNAEAVCSWGRTLTSVPNVSIIQCVGNPGILDRTKLEAWINLIDIVIVDNYEYADHCQRRTTYWVSIVSIPALCAVACEADYEVKQLLNRG